jgi:hypothetical protein
MDVLHVVEAFGTAFVLILAYLWWRDRPKGKTTTIAVPTSIKASILNEADAMRASLGLNFVSKTETLIEKFQREAKAEAKAAENAAASLWPKLFAHGAPTEPTPVSTAKHDLSPMPASIAGPMGPGTTKVITSTGSIRIVNPGGRPLDLKKDENGDLRITIL